MIDSREQLEAEINRFLSQAGTDEMVAAWLDRQAAITRAECKYPNLLQRLNEEKENADGHWENANKWAKERDEWKAKAEEYREKAYSLEQVGLDMLGELRDAEINLYGVKWLGRYSDAYADRLRALGLEVGE